MDDLQNPLSNNNQTDDPATPLSEDGNTPAAPADDQGSSVPADQPSTDSGLDDQEAQDEGTAGAAEVEDPQNQPPGGPAVV
jgi:hypothetical protein